MVRKEHRSLSACEADIEQRGDPTARGPRCSFWSHGDHFEHRAVPYFAMAEVSNSAVDPALFLIHL
jgi:hypothetical protein